MLNMSSDFLIRFATPEELEHDNTWYRAAPFKPARFVHEDGNLVALGQAMGLRGITLTALRNVPQETQAMEVPCADVSHIATPPTPRGY